MNYYAFCLFLITTIAFASASTNASTDSPQPHDQHDVNLTDFSSLLCYNSEGGKDCLVYRLAMAIIDRLFSDFDVDQLDPTAQNILRLARIMRQGVIPSQAICNSELMAREYAKADLKDYTAEIVAVLAQNNASLAEEISVQSHNIARGWSLNISNRHLKDKRLFEQECFIKLPNLLTIRVRYSISDDSAANVTEKIYTPLTLNLNENNRLITYKLDFIIAKAARGDFLVLSRKQNNGWGFTEPMEHSHEYPNLVVERITNPRGSLVYRSMVLIYRRRIRTEIH